MNRKELRLIEEQTRRVLRDHNIDLNKVCLTQQTMRQAVDDWCKQFGIHVYHVGTIYGSYDVVQIGIRMKRQLQGKWTIDRDVDIVSVVSDEVVDYFVKILRHDLDQELLYDLCIMSGWKGVRIPYQQVDEIKEWVETNTMSEVRFYNNRIAFKESKDFEYFILRWS